MRHIVSLGIIPLLIGCDICAGIDANGAEGLCGEAVTPDAGVAPGCWSGLAGARDPTTVATANAPEPPRPVLCGRSLAYHFSPACVETPSPNGADGIDNDCDGMIDEDGPGGYPAPPPIPKSSAYILGGDSARQIDVTGQHCGHVDCSATVARLEQSYLVVPLRAQHTEIGRLQK